MHDVLFCGHTVVQVVSKKRVKLFHCCFWTITSTSSSGDEGLSKRKTVLIPYTETAITRNQCISNDQRAL